MVASFCHYGQIFENSNWREEGLSGLTEGGKKSVVVGKACGSDYEERWRESGLAVFLPGFLSMTSNPWVILFPFRMGHPLLWSNLSGNALSRQTQSH